MRQLLDYWRGRLLQAGWVVLVLGLAGCASTQQIWNGRVGQYTYDQAVLELGPPDKSATLEDGTRVAEWLTVRGHAGRSIVTGYGYYPTTAVWYEPGAPDMFLRLTFGPDGKLKEWKRVYK
ncbi:MAG: hypothetical protein N3J91_05655 [Verrucomicrobiae bacterium]|nr:hypothetical protein [Verrucomicrobiae bacterium]